MSSQLSSCLRTGRLTFGAHRVQTSSFRLGAARGGGGGGADGKVSMETLCLSLLMSNYL